MDNPQKNQFYLPFFDNDANANPYQNPVPQLKEVSFTPAPVKTYYSSDQLFQKELTVLGTILVDRIYANSLTSLTTIVANDSLFNQPLTVLGDCYARNLSITAVTILDTIAINNLTVMSNLIVTGNQTNVGNITITNSLIMDNGANIDNLSILNNFTVSNLTSIGNITINKDFINTNLTVLGDVQINNANITNMTMPYQMAVTNINSEGSVTILSTLTTQDIYVYGTGYFQDLEVDNIDFGSNTKLKNISVLTSIIVYGNESVTGNLSIIGNISADEGLFTWLSDLNAMTILNDASFTTLIVNGNQYIANLFQVTNNAYSSNLISTNINISQTLYSSNLTSLASIYNMGDLTTVGQLYIRNSLLCANIQNTYLQNISQLVTSNLWIHGGEEMIGNESISGNLEITQNNKIAAIYTNIATNLTITNNLIAPYASTFSNISLSGQWNLTNVTVGGNLYWNSQIVNSTNAFLSNIVANYVTMIDPLFTTDVTILSNMQVNTLLTNNNIYNGTALYPNLYTTNLTTLQTASIVLSQLSAASDLILINGTEYIGSNGSLLFDKQIKGYIHWLNGTNLTILMDGNRNIQLGNITAINQLAAQNKYIIGDLTAVQVTANYLQITSLTNITNLDTPNIQCNNLSILGGNQTIASVLYLNPTSVAYIPTIIVTNLTTTGNMLINVGQITQLYAEIINTSNLTVTNKANIYRFSATNGTGITNMIQQSILATNLINYQSELINSTLQLNSPNFNSMVNVLVNTYINSNLVVSNLTAATAYQTVINIPNIIISSNITANSEIITTLNPLTNIVLQSNGTTIGNITNNGNLLIQQNLTSFKTNQIPQIMNNNVSAIQLYVSNISNISANNSNTLYGLDWIRNSLLVQNVVQMSNLMLMNLTVLSNIVLNQSQVSNLSILGNEYLQSTITILGTASINNAQFSNMTAVNSVNVNDVTLLGNINEGYGANSYNTKTILGNLIGLVTSVATMSNLQTNNNIQTTNLNFTNLNISGNLTIVGNEQVNNMTIGGIMTGSQLIVTNLQINNIQTSNLLFNTKIVLGSEITTNLTVTNAYLGSLFNTNLINTNIIIASAAPSITSVTILSNLSQGNETIMGNLYINQLTPLIYNSLTATNITITGNLNHTGGSAGINPLPYISVLSMNTLKITNSNLTGIGTSNQSLLGTDSNGFMTAYNPLNYVWEYNNTVRGIYKSQIDVTNTYSNIVSIYPGSFSVQTQNTALSALSQWQVGVRGMTNVGDVFVSVLTNFGESYVSSGTLGSQIVANVPTSLQNNIGVNAFNGNIVVNGNYSSNNMGIYRNRIINGGMQVNQRTILSTTISTTGVQAPPVGDYVADRFSYNRNISSGSYTISQLSLLSSDTPYNYGQTNGMGQTMISTVGLAPTGYLFGNYKMEFDDMADFQWGTTEGIPVTLSFWWKTNLPKNWITIMNNQAATKYYYISTYLVTVGTWNYAAFTIPPPPAGSVWSTAGLLIGFNMVAGSSIATTATVNQWQTTGYSPTLGVGETPLTIGNYFNITGLQLEKGTIATPYQIKPYTTEIEHCLRYYERIYYQPGAYDYFYALNTTDSTLTIKKKMRNKRSNDATSVTVINRLNVTTYTNSAILVEYDTNLFYFIITLQGASRGGYYILGTGSYIDLNNEIHFG